MTAQTVLEPRAPILIYLDHSILNQMLKGREKLRAVLTSDNIQVVYSDVNLAEIAASRGHEDEFLSLLGAFAAKYLRQVLDDGLHLKDRAVVETIPPSEALAAFLENQQESPAGDFGLGGLLHKFYGGNANKTFEGIAISGQEDFSALLDTQAQELAAAELPPGFDKTALLRALPEMKRMFAAICSKSGQTLDADVARNNVKAIGSELGVGPEYLNNLVGPGILDQIWKRVVTKIPGGALTFDEFFGLVRPRWVTDNRPMTKLEQINGAYHQLNFLGYWRDEEMKREQKFEGHLKDLTHVGMASFCDVFLSGDERQVKKAKAVYEHLRIGTYAHHIPPP